MPVLQSGLPDIVGDDEDLARFLASSRWFSSNGPKGVAFLPTEERETSVLETSVYRHGGYPRDELWAIFHEHVRLPRFHGAAIVKARDVRAEILDIVAHEPPPRHAAIRGWPTDNDPAVQKAQQKLRAAQIASKATLLLVDQH
jgi:hypothetical protein